MKKKIPLLLASTLTVSMLGACSYQKEDNKAGARKILKQASAKSN